jgi:hypothetical protein
MVQEGVRLFQCLREHPACRDTGFHVCLLGHPDCIFEPAEPALLLVDTAPADPSKEAYQFCLS